MERVTNAAINYLCYTMETNTLSSIDIQQLRAETSGTKQKIHFNNAGASLPPDIVVDTVVNYLQEEALLGGYEIEYDYREQLDNTYSLVAQLINANKDEIALVENASMGWWTAFNGLQFKPGDEIITSEFEYVTNLIGLLHAKKKFGITIKLVPNNEQGDFDINKLEEAITPNTKLIAVTHVPSTAGGVLPVAEIGKVAKKHNIIYLLDACQSVGHIPVDVKEIGCDMLCVTGRKYLRAPRGTGFLYVKKEIQDKLEVQFIDGFTTQWVTTDDYKLKDNAHRFEVYEKNRALSLGLGKAVEYTLNIGIDKIWQRIQYIAGYMRAQLSAIKGVTVHDAGSVQCGIVTFTVAGIDSYIIKNKLAEQNINTSVAKAISALYFMNRHGIASSVRASVHYYNTEEEVNQLCSALKAIIAG